MLGPNRDHGAIADHADRIVLRTRIDNIPAGIGLDLYATNQNPPLRFLCRSPSGHLMATDLDTAVPQFPGITGAETASATAQPAGLDRRQWSQFSLQ